MLAHRLNEEVLAEVPHRQWVFTIPKRLRVYFRYDRKLLGKLYRAAYDTGMQRLAQYIARCPFSLTRMVSITKDGKILYRASHAQCIPFPLSGDTTLMKGMPRNYELYDPLDFLAEVTQHIPNKGEHQVRYYGFYSNKKRGHHLKKMAKPAPAVGDTEPDTTYRRKCRMTWAALIKAVFEVDPLKCPTCGGTMKIVAFIEEKVVIKKILKHCNLWKEEPARPPPTTLLAENTVTEPVYDYSFIEPA